jgi:hypothetical protein
MTLPNQDDYQKSSPNSIFDKQFDVQVPVPQKPDPDLAKKELAKRELARRHVLDFVYYNFKNYDANWHHRIIADKLEAVERGDILRLMLFLPPRHGKSELGSVQMPAWFLGRNPDKEIINASYSSDLAVDFGRRVRNLVGSPEFGNLFRVNLAEDSKAANKWNTDQGGSYTAVGVGGPITGRGADVLIIDDPFKNRQEADSPVIRNQVWSWYTSTAYTRLSPRGAIIVICTRWHDDDLAGRLLADTTGDKWEVVSLPAIAVKDESFKLSTGEEFHYAKGSALWPTRFDLERLEKTKQVIGSYEWASLYQQNPVDEQSIEFKKEWFKTRTEKEVDALNTRRFLTIDTAGRMTGTSDYTGIVDNRVDTEGFWNIKAMKYKIGPEQLVEMIFALQQANHYERIGIEKTIYLDALKMFLDMEAMKRKIVLPIIELKHGGIAKQLRIRGLLPRYQYGRIFHIDSACDELIPQLIRFPKGSEDDILDALAYQDQIAEAPFGWQKEDFPNADGETQGKSSSFDPFNPLGEI